MACAMFGMGACSSQLVEVEEETEVYEELENDTGTTDSRSLFDSSIGNGGSNNHGGGGSSHNA